MDKLKQYQFADLWMKSAMTEDGYGNDNQDFDVAELEEQ